MYNCILFVAYYSLNSENIEIKQIKTKKIFIHFDFHEQTIGV